MFARSAAVCVDTHPLATVQIAATAIIVVVSFIEGTLLYILLPLPEYCNKRMSRECKS